MKLSYIKMLGLWIFSLFLFTGLSNFCFADPQLGARYYPYDEQIVLDWSSKSNQDVVEIWVYNYVKSSDELFATAPGDNNGYKIDVTCDFINKYTQDGKSAFKLVGLYKDNTPLLYNFSNDKSIYEKKCVPTTQSVLDGIDGALNNISYSIYDGMLFFKWGDVGSAEKVNISVFDTIIGKYDSFGDISISVGMFYIDLDCLFYNRYIDSNGLIKIRLTSPSGKVFTDTVNGEKPSYCYSPNNVVMNEENSDSDNEDKDILELDDYTIDYDGIVENDIITDVTSDTGAENENTTGFDYRYIFYVVGGIIIVGGIIWFVRKRKEGVKTHSFIF